MADDPKAKVGGALKALPLVAILRGVRPEEIADQALALYEAGFRVVETPLNSPDPFRTLETLAAIAPADLAWGAGTVLSEEAVDRAADLGAALIVAPDTRPEVIGRALMRGLEPMPGFATPSEALRAVDAGASRLKLFPAQSLSPGFLSQTLAVLPREIEAFAVGGVGEKDFAHWRRAGARGLGLGGELYRPGQDPQRTGERARSIVRAWRAAESQTQT